MTATVILSSHRQAVVAHSRSCTTVLAFRTPPRQAGSELLIRAAQNRHVQAELDTLLPKLTQAPSLSEFRLEVQCGRKRQARTAQLGVQALTVTLIALWPGDAYG